MSNRKVGDLLTVDDVMKLAQRRLPRMVFDYIQGGADDEVSVTANEQAFDAYRFRPHVLRDVSTRDLSVNILGQQFSMPVILAPTGLPGLANPGGEVAAGMAAKDAGTILTISSASSYDIETVAREVGGALWFQLYTWGDRHVVSNLIDRAYAEDYASLVVTVDVAVASQRNRDRRNGFTIPPTLRAGGLFDAAIHPRWWLGLLRGPKVTFANLEGIEGIDNTARMSVMAHAMRLLNPATAWTDIEWIRSEWDRPLLIKGILRPEDARRAVEVGADGIVVSNHGGRQLDGAMASLEALPDIVQQVKGAVPILIDGGIRRGSDIVKSIALGASACMIGRPYLYGLAVGGSIGVGRVLEILRSEIDRTLALLGCASFAELDSSFVTPSLQAVSRGIPNLGFAAGPAAGRNDDGGRS